MARARSIFVVHTAPAIAEADRVADAARAARREQRRRGQHGDAKRNRAVVEPQVERRVARVHEPALLEQEGKRHAAVHAAPAKMLGV
jgi:hypothetical protein